MKKIGVGESIVVALPQISIDDALKILELDATKLGDAQAVKQAYRKAAMKHHPDHGGSQEMMKKVNEAYELLQDAKGGSGGGSKVDWEAIRQRKKQAEAIVTETLKKDFKPDVFTDYFKKQVGKDFSVTSLVFSGDKNIRDPYHTTFTASWTSDDKLTAFWVQGSVTLSDVVWPTPSLSGGADPHDIGYDMFFFVEIFHNNRKVKFTPSSTTRSQLKSVLWNPEKLFPPKKISDMIAPKAKQRAFSKRDMIIGIERRLGGRVSMSGTSGWAYIPIGDPSEKFELVLWRHTLVGVGAWGGNQIVQRQAPHAKLNTATFTAPESEATLDALAELQRKVAHLKDIAQLAAAVKDAFGRKVGASMKIQATNLAYAQVAAEIKKFLHHFFNKKIHENPKALEAYTEFRNTGYSVAEAFFTTQERFAPKLANHIIFDSRDFRYEVDEYFKYHPDVEMSDELTQLTDTRELYEAFDTLWLKFPATFDAFKYTITRFNQRYAGENIHVQEQYLEPMSLMYIAFMAESKMETATVANLKVGQSTVVPAV